MAGKAKAKTIIVHLFSSARTGYFYTTTRARASAKLTQVKYDPKVKQHVLFVEKKSRAK
ncbi:SubName: Full=Uncharacterized protein {ECO:0000313/EMBL:CCA68616.1} [Serendipita indica DSM 11827]|uniref:Large ribosomal subunit protein bL33m n=1 Tax=Serendipita indica (strain DSM 11827) TaxID=1109443 RepID=G4TBA9_SERID|nr:SubName: Full=Uncharacterized protein {ECO:0000313/EMBL:CCA68616.1} [Serendipita indica DSM 11827]CCA68616.1 hypothetical protein PIIN_02480 [Serendipita indica DSM 11827]